MAALSWIRDSDPGKWPPFISNRAAEIQRTAAADSWNYVNTKDSPADLASRGINPAQLANSQLWWHGPNWLIQDPDQWPKYFEQIKKKEPSEEAREARPSRIKYCNVLIIDELIDRFSTW